LNLFSHSDQQLQWQTSVAQGHSPTGWAGRAADYIASQNFNSSNFPTFFSVAGNSLEAPGLYAAGRPGPRTIAHPRRFQFQRRIAGALERVE